MKRMKHRFLALVLVIVLGIASLGMAAMAKDAGGSADAELMRILYEKTDNPQLWLQFIEDNKGDATGKWLPQLIKKLGGTETAMDKIYVEIGYRTVTEGFDWGPAITKVVVDFKNPVDGLSLTRDTFKVASVRQYKDFDFATFSFAQAATDHETARDVTDVYLADAEGNPAESGQYVAIEMTVGPTMSESSPFNYNMLTGFNEYVETSYKIELAEGAVLKAEDGRSLVFASEASQKNGDIQRIADDFVNNQSFSSDGIDLLYADYTPESASDEAGSNPLIIWLHGAGEGGKDTTIALLGNKVVNLATDSIQQHFGETGAYVLVPQAPTMWMDYDGTKTYNNSVEGSAGKSHYTQALMALIDSYVTAHPEIDKNRIYIGGCSNGGYMTVNMITTYPDYFAAAYPICEAYSDSWLTEEKLAGIIDMPIWLTHAMSDSVVPIAKAAEGASMFNYILELDQTGKPIPLADFSNALYDRLAAAGATNVHYSRFDKVIDPSGLYFGVDGKTPYEYMGHWSWIYTLNNACSEMIDGQEISIFEWLSEQSK